MIDGQFDETNYVSGFCFTSLTSEGRYSANTWDVDSFIVEGNRPILEIAKPCPIPAIYGLYRVLSLRLLSNIENKYGAFNSIRQNQFERGDFHVTVIVT